MKFFKKMAIVFVFLQNNVHCAESRQEPWTWLYTKKFSAQEMEKNSGKKELLFYRQAYPFGQLVFSWNAVRPDEGHFSFWVQARDKGTQQWGAWHKMMAWGNKLQQSFIHSGDEYTHYAHVRLEAKDKRLADAFRIRIQAHDNASLRTLKSFNVCTSDFARFSEENPSLFHALPSVSIPNVPKYSQFMLDHPRKDSICSPTSCSMLTAFLTQRHIDPVAFADKAYDSGLGVYGSWPFNIAHAYEHCAEKFSFAVARFSSFKWLHTWLSQGIPVVVSVRGPLYKAPRPYAHGHLLVVVGWDQERKEVLCHDPAHDSTELVATAYPLKDFLPAWERSRRLVYLAYPAHERAL